MRYILALVMLIPSVLYANVLYCERSDGAYISYSGMDQSKVEAMLSDQKLSCKFIDKTSYDEAYEAKVAIIKQNDEKEKSDKAALLAIIKDTKLPVEDRFVVLIQYLGI